VTSYPGGQHLGSASIDMPYRYNWSAPLAWSPFDWHVMYHGANVLFRSSDGDNWTPMSPDLTRNNKAHQGRSGPFWHDGSGGDIYNTITVVVESPRERGTIWVGTDDGLVQLTRDNGKTWKNVTPESWGEGLIQSIDVGPHANGTAYVAFSRYKWDDNTPHFMVTRDYGATWTDLAKPLPQEDPARVIREDPVRKDLLFAGTEAGLWISFDGGTRWQSFQRGVPITPVSDIQIHHDDLIVATEGRGFFILDDMTPLRQLDATVVRAPLFLFSRPPAVRAAGTPRGGGLSGNAPIRYSLGAPVPAGDTLQLDILNSAGTVIRHVATAGASSAQTTSAGRGGRGGRGGDAAQLGTAKGTNQFVWDFRGRENSNMNMYAMRAGTYTVRMNLGATTVTKPLIVLADPRAGGSALAEREHGTMSETLATTIATVNRTLGSLRDARKQAKAAQERAKTSPVADRDAALRSFVATVDSLELLIVNVGTENAGPLDILSNPPKLMTDLNGLLSTIEGTSGPVTSGEREQLARLRSRSSSFITASDRLLSTTLAKVNSLLGASGMATITRHAGDAP